MNRARPTTRSDRFRIVHIEADGRRSFGVEGVQTRESARQHNRAALRFGIGIAFGWLIALALTYAGLPW